jgi:hypothetical protein
MASTYTVNTGIELIANGEQSGTWGTTTNANLEIIDRLTNGVGAITLSGTTHTLTTTDGTLSDGQYKVLVFGGSPSGTNTVTISPNDQDKQYFILNSSGQSVVLTQGSGGNVSIANGKSAIVFADGAGAGAAVTDLTATFIPAGALIAANNLSDLVDAPTALTNLGLTATAAELNILDGVTASTAELNILDGVTASTAELNILDGVTASTAELNILDGVTASTAELNILDGVTASTAELNILDGVTASTAELNILDGVTASTAELNYLDITTLGTSEASKVVTADANGNVILAEEVQATAYLETVVALSGTTPTVDCDEGNSFTLTTSGNTTFTFDYSGINLTTNDSYGFTLKVTAGGTHTLTWPASVDWPGGTAPDAPADTETDVFVFYTVDGGTNWYGFQAGDAMA